VKNLAIADLFCGAGGTSEGAVEAIRALGFAPQLTAINHWDVAIATHTANHPTARHLCTSLDNINPRHLFKEGELEILWASPECTHHSVARGGKPINDQSRATAWCVVRWAEALRPNIILVENVPEFETWGAIGTNGRPLKTKRGATFIAWVNALESLGYSVDWRVLCAADYGDPTTRRRLFVQAVRGRRKIIWPNPTHAPKQDTDLLGSRKPWVAAREIIDWKLQGQSIYERKRPLSPKTMRRIMAGLEKFGLKPFIVPQQSNPTPKSVDDPLPTVCAEGSMSKLCEPFLVAQFGERDGQAPRVHSIDQPVPTVTAQKGAPALAQPFLICMEHQGSVRSVEKPLPTITTAKGGAMAVAQPFLVKLRGTNNAADVEKPAPTITASGTHLGLAEPFLIETAHAGERRPRSVDEPMTTVAGNRGGTALVQAELEPFVISAGGPKCEARGVSKPLGTVLTRAHRALVTPSLLPQHAGGALRPIDQPAPTIACDGAVALVEPFLVEYYGTKMAAAIATATISGAAAFAGISIFSIFIFMSSWCLSGMVGHHFLLHLISLHFWRSRKICNAMRCDWRGFCSHKAETHREGAA
jgi:DNA (cytosine-5)-methyltransferase 1